MTILFDPILLEDPKFKDFISNKEILSTYRTLPECNRENIAFFNSKTCRVIYSYQNPSEALRAKQEILKNPLYKDLPLKYISQERNLLIIIYTEK